MDANSLVDVGSVLGAGSGRAQSKENKGN